MAKIKSNFKLEEVVKNKLKEIAKASGMNMTNILVYLINEKHLEMLKNGQLDEVLNIKKDDDSNV